MRRASNRLQICEVEQIGIIPWGGFNREETMVEVVKVAQHQIPIHSLDQSWLWCESWCSDASKAESKTIDLCNNPLHKEPKVSMAKRIIDGPLFKESWVELDEIVQAYFEEWRENEGDFDE